jgi:hypothetical protein
MKDLKIIDFAVIMILAAILYFSTQNATKTEIAEAQLQAQQAKELATAQAIEIEKLKLINQDMLKIIDGLAGKNKTAKEDIYVMQQTYDLKADSTHRQIAKAKAALEEMFRETFKKLNQ